MEFLRITVAETSVLFRPYDIALMGSIAMKSPYGDRISGTNIGLVLGTVNKDFELPLSIDLFVKRLRLAMMELVELRSQDEAMIVVDIDLTPA